MTTQERLARRDFLKQLSAASVAALGCGGTRAWGESKATIIHPRAKADSCILIWLAGGMAAPDTFDPKRYLPFEKGLDVEKILSTFPAIDTSVDNIKISKGMENIAKVMDRGTLIRSAVQPDLGHILHSRHQYHWHTGYVPPLTVAAPHIGAWMGKVLGPRNPVVPPFINIGQRLEGVGEKEELLYGATADERPLVAVENPVSVMDLHSTIFTAMGINPQTVYEVEKRPFFATKDGHGKAVMDVFA